MNTVLEQVLTGTTDMVIFLNQLQNAPSLQAYMRSLLPEPAKNDPSHSFWKVVPYETMLRNHFDYYQFLFWGLHSNNKYGIHLNIFSRLQRVYQYYYPDFACTNKYSDAYDLYLDIIQDCFDGPEVLHIVERVMDELLHLQTKAQRKKYGQAAIKEWFHITSKKRPRWIHGPEWPMGQNTPMQFVSQKRNGDKVQFTFNDVDTGETRVIDQFY